MQVLFRRQGKGLWLAQVIAKYDWDSTRTLDVGSWEVFVRLLVLTTTNRNVEILSGVFSMVNMYYEHYNGEIWRHQQTFELKWLNGRPFLTSSLSPSIYLDIYLDIHPPHRKTAIWEREKRKTAKSPFTKLIRVAVIGSQCKENWKIDLGSLSLRVLSSFL